MSENYANGIIIGGWLLIAFLLPIWQRLLPPLLIGLAALTILLSWYQNDWKIGNFNWSDFKSILLIFILIFLWHLVGLLWSANIEYASRDITQKSAFVLLPLYFLWRNEQSKIVVDLVLLVFIFGCFIGIGFNIFKSIQVAVIEGWSLSHFTENNFSHLVHKTYFSLFLNFAWISALFLIERRSSEFRPSLINLLKAFIPIAWIVVLVLGSRIAILSCVLIGLLVLIRAWKRGERNTRLIILTSTAIVGMGIGTYFLPTVQKDFKEIYEKTVSEPIDIKEEESTTARLLVLKSAFELIKSHYLIGVGTGDVKDELLNHYKKMGYSGAYSTKLNAHNQFLQIFISLGLIGFLLMVISVLYLFYLAVRNKNELLYAFSILLFLVLMTESALEVQTGISFFTFFGAFLVLCVPKDYFDNQKGRLLFGI